MKAPQRVVWTEGMYVGPQHMQQQDRYHECLLAARLEALAPFDWGVLAVEVDARALVAGQVRLQRFEGILPDGLPVSFDANHPEAPAARSIEGHFGPTQHVLQVFLGVPVEREGQVSTTMAPAAAPSQRFFTSLRSVRDATGAGADLELPFARRNVVLLFGDEAREEFETLKVAEIVREAGGALAVRPEYIPSCRRISASPWLLNGLRKLLSLMAAKQRTLAGTLRQRDAATVEYTAGDVTRFLLLNAVNSYLPVMNFLTEQGNLAPEAVYLQLAQFAGQLSAFAVEFDPTTLPKFEYHDLSATFTALLDRITELLQLTIRDQYISVPLESREDGLHFARLDDERLSRGAAYVLAVRSAHPEAQTADQIPKLSKIASWEDIGTIVHAATAGIGLAVTYRPPPEIPVRAGLLYFTLGQSGQWWQSVCNERTIAIYLPPPYDPSMVTLELMAVPVRG